MKKEGLQMDELNEILKKWMQIFQLNDWKISIEISDFKRKDFKQSGDLKVDLENKTATLLMTDKPFRNEESTIVHELTHLLPWKFDMFSEKVILKKGWICSNRAWILATMENSQWNTKSR